MIERVARAIADSDGDSTVMNHHRRRARAAIAEMRKEVSIAMLEAGAFSLADGGGAIDVWVGMIDAALKE